jgi:hypothetical protein
MPAEGDEEVGAAAVLTALGGFNVFSGESESFDGHRIIDWATALAAMMSPSSFVRGPVQARSRGVIAWPWHDVRSSFAL